MGKIYDLNNDEEFKNAMALAFNWFLENCNPHQKIEISYDGVTILADDAFCPIDLICEE